METVRQRGCYLALYSAQHAVFFPVLPPPVHLHRHQRHRPLCSDLSIHVFYKNLANTNRPHAPGNAKTMFPLFSTLSTRDRSVCRQTLEAVLSPTADGWAASGRPDVGVARLRE